MDFYQIIQYILLEKEDLLMVVGVATFLTIARIMVQQYFQKVAKRLGVDEVKKFSESSWKLIFYVTSLAWGGFVVLNEGWFPDTSLCWKGIPVRIEPMTRIFYLYELGFYFHSVFAHAVLEVVRSDFWFLLFHHLVTIFLIYWSYAVGYYRIGLLVLVCHDIADIPLEMGKIFVYLKNETFKTLTYVLILLSWAGSRLYIFPKYILYSAYFESSIYITYVPQHFPFNVSLSLLQILHIYWFCLIIRMGVKILLFPNEAKLEDIREKKED